VIHGCKNKYRISRETYDAKGFDAII